MERRVMNLIKILLGISVFTFWNCGSDKTDYQSLSVDEFEKLIVDPDVQRLDVRTVAEYSEGHVPSSLNINVLDEEHFSAIADSLLIKSQPVALYCRSGKRSKKAAEQLSKQGFKVFELNKGFNAWKSAGKEIE